MGEAACGVMTRCLPPPPHARRPAQHPRHARGGSRTPRSPPAAPPPPHPRPSPRAGRRAQRPDRLSQSPAARWGCRSLYWCFLVCAPPHIPSPIYAARRRVPRSSSICARQPADPISSAPSADRSPPPCASVGPQRPGASARTLSPPAARRRSRARTPQHHLWLLRAPSSAARYIYPRPPAPCAILQV